MKYVVTDAAAQLEINGKMYNTGDVLEASDFAPAPEAPAPTKTREEMVAELGEEEVARIEREAEPILGELESLLKSGHVKEVNE